MTNQNKAALVSVQDLEYVVQQPRQAGSVADEEGELIDRLDHLQSRLRACSSGRAGGIRRILSRSSPCQPQLR